MANLEVATEILNQLGGKRFLVMTGTKNLMGDTNSLSMHLTRNKMKAKNLKIELMGNDTYTMTFSTMLGFEHIIIETITGVYNDMLQNIFTSKTGLYTKF